MGFRAGVLGSARFERTNSPAGGRTLQTAMRATIGRATHRSGLTIPFLAIGPYRLREWTIR